MSSYLKRQVTTFLFQSDYCSLRYQSSTYQHHLEASTVLFGHSENILDRRYAVLNSEDSITTVAELRFDFLRPLLSKTKSVETD